MHKKERLGQEEVLHFHEKRFSVPTWFSHLCSASLTTLKREGIALSCKPWEIPHLWEMNPLLGTGWCTQQWVQGPEQCCTELPSLPGEGLNTSGGQQIKVSSSRHLQSTLMPVLLADRFLASPVWPFLLLSNGRRMTQRSWTESSCLVLTVPELN